MQPDLARCHDEQRAAAEELKAGHPYRMGLVQCIEDWVMEEIFIRRIMEAINESARES